MESFFLWLFQMLGCQAKLSARSLSQDDRKSVHPLVPRNEERRHTRTCCHLPLPEYFDADLHYANIAQYFVVLRTRWFASGVFPGKRLSRYTTCRYRVHAGCKSRPGLAH
jgi:hypothetical protein